FFWLYAVGSILGGWLGGRVAIRWLLAGIAVIWAITLTPMIGQVGFATLVVCRVILGFAEGPAVALVMHVTHTWFPADKRALPSSLVAIGSTGGPVIAAPVVTWIISGYSWHTAFAVLAVTGGIVAVLWLVFGAEGPYRDAGAGERQAARSPLPQRLPLVKVLTTRTLIGLAVLFVSTFAIMSVKITWLPMYLRQGLGYDAGTASRLVSLTYLGVAIAVVATGLVSSAMTRKGMSNRTTRGVLAGGVVVFAGLATVTFPLLDRGAALLVLVVVSGSLTSAGYGVAFAGLSDVVPAGQRGLVFGIITAVYSIGGIVAPAVMGVVVNSSADPKDGYGQGFMILGFVMIVGAVISILMVNPERDVAKLSALAKS
ncbi:MFS transporter, partial [Streptomyces sp. NPDC055078]